MSGDKRNYSLEQFKVDPKLKVFVMSTKLAACGKYLGGVKLNAKGLTLISSTHAFIMDPTLSAGIEEQAINRIHRWNLSYVVLRDSQNRAAEGGHD